MRKIAVLLALCLILTGCDNDPKIRQVDEEFVKKIKLSFKDKKYIKVSELYPGDWLEVCSYYAGANGNLKLRLKEKFKTDLNQINLINDSPYYMTENVGLLYFVYPNHTIQTFQFYFPNISIHSGERECFSKQEAFIKIVKDLNNFSKEAQQNMSSDYIGIKLITK